MKSTKTSSSESYFDKIDRARELIADADRIIVGAGAGLSASGGLNYGDPELVRSWFPGYFSAGFRSLPMIQSVYWDINESDPVLYWGYWAQHIFRVRHDPPALPPHTALARLLADKEYFICTTNVDGQFLKAEIPSGRIHAPQGDYALFQCSKPCCDEVFPNEQMIRAMINGIAIDDRHLPRIRREDVPRCPRCGALLKPNLRCDDTFVETPHLKNLDAYQSFVQRCVTEERRTVLLELGAGFNTPIIIRYPFEHWTESIPFFSLIRINQDHAEVPRNIEHRSISIAADIGKALGDLL